MKTCDDCGKKFSFLEKVYQTDTNTYMCQGCVDNRRDGITNTQQAPMNAPNDYSVTLNDVPQQQVQQTMQQSNQGYVSVALDDQSSSGWEFRVVKLSVSPEDARKGAVTIERFEKTINKMGEDGWEIVNVVPLNLILMRGSERNEPAMIFKRRA